MRTKGFTWYWPLSFLAALGQLLLLLTHNAGGPPLGRIMLSLWVFLIPGIWLGNLLIKQELRVPEAFALRFSLALGVSYLILLMRPWISSSGSANTLILLSLGASLVYTFRPMRRSGNARVSEKSRAIGQLVSLVTLALILGNFWATGSEANHSSTDPRSMFPAWVDLIMHMSAQSQEQVLHVLPMLSTPLLFLSICFLGWVTLDHRLLGLLSGLLALFFLWAEGQGLGWASNPATLGLIPFFAAVGLWLDGLVEPNPRHIPAWALIVLGVVATHQGYGLLLGIIFALLALRSATSINRLQESVPFFVAYLVPTGLVLALWLVLRPDGSNATSSIPQTPTLNYQEFPWGTYWAGILATLFLPVLLKRGLDNPKPFYLVSTSLTLLILGYTTWGFAWLPGNQASLLPWLCPVPVALVGLTHWSWDGMQRSHGLVWLRIIFLILLLAVMAHAMIRYFTP